MSFNDPVDNIEWVHYSELDPNDWNPNYVPEKEMRVLARSIEEDGWTQPIVVTEDYQIIDGYHRYLCVKRGLNGYEGMIPVSIAKWNNEEDKRVSTVRHNRARGNHVVQKMSRLVKEILEAEDPEYLIEKLGMEEEEVKRLASEVGATGQGKEELSKGWVPTDKTDRKPSKWEE